MHASPPSPLNAQAGAQGHWAARCSPAAASSLSVGVPKHGTCERMSTARTGFFWSSADTQVGRADGEDGAQAPGAQLGDLLH
jgi:hypothetical protein